LRIINKSVNNEGMIEIQHNPFKFGDPVDGEYYSPRPELTRTITQFLSNRIHVVLIGPRRFGKTSFVLNLLEGLENQSYVCVAVDIFNITSHRDFLQQLLRALSSKKSLWKKMKDFFSYLRPKISAEIDPNSGQPCFGITMEQFSDSDVKEAIQDALSRLNKLGDRVIFAVDEFQKICEIDDQGWLEATLRTHMQQQRNTSFLFTGSRKSLIYDMLNNNSRPLYRSCQSIEFPSFGEEFTDWVITRFLKVGIKCELKAIQNLRKWVQDTPNYVQMVCFHLVAEGVPRITQNAVKNALERVVGHNAYAYQTLLNTLTLTQQRALRLAAIEGKQIFHKQLLAKYEIASGAALASAIKALKEKGILDDEGTRRGFVVFDDPLFAMWLKTS
jgi:uncharacterized protein